MTVNQSNSAHQFLSQIKSVMPDIARERDVEGLNELLFNNPAFTQLMQASAISVAISSYASMTYEYFSPNIESMVGCPLEKLKGMSGAEFALNLFHPEHLNILVKQTETIKKFYATYAAQQRVTDTRCVWTAQLKNGSGEYFWTLHETMVLHVTPEGFPLRTIIFVSDLSGIKTNNKVDFIFTVKEGSGYETIHRSSHEVGAEYTLTEREIDILNYTRKGMRNQEIADALHISKHTVTTHKRNIMKKTGKESIIQLLSE